MRSFLSCTASLTDLSGRLRYLLVDLLSSALYDLGSDATALERLVDLLLEKQSEVGAMIVVEALFDSGNQDGIARLSGRAKGKILQLIRDTRQKETLSQLAEFVQIPGLSGELILLGAHTINHVGLPQQPRPGRDPTLQTPAISAQQLYDIVTAADMARLASPWVQLRTGLLTRLDQRRTKGVREDKYRLGDMEIRAGDWLLMKNPSPYNLFTDLYPGLYTHVGVVAVEQGSDGQRRFVIIDLPEIGNSIPAVTVDTFVKRTLDYVFLRHNDPVVASRMAKVAQAVIGNESKFDLNFRTDGIEKLKGQNLSGKKIDGYCAGLLLLCAQESEKPRHDFFPIPEHPARGKTLANLRRLDVSMDRDFLSPTGPLFSPHMKVVGRSRSMYSPRREIEQAIYDHFARQMRQRQLVPSRDWAAALKVTLAKTFRDNPTVNNALADAAGVNRNMDLVAAAKLGAVVQTLDVFAYGASGDFGDTRRAFRIGRIQDLQAAAATGAEIDEVLNYRRQHADLYVRWEAGMISPRQLRLELVNYYISDGKRQLDQRFFS
ncbi:MAG: hypothetical protein N2C12_17355, partial [Planctomycetales bacterium]